MKVAIVTLGCKTNEYEATQIGDALAALGYDVCYGLESADFFVLNTCSITHRADAKSRQLVARALEKNKNAKIIVCGCSSQYDKKYFENHKSVIAVFGTADKFEAVKIFEQIAQSKLAPANKTRRLIKIGDGCNNFCTYCIVPYLRGRATSRTIEEIVNEIENASEKEVVITAINLNNFVPGLPELFAAMKDVDKRVRLGSIEPQMITKSFLEAYKGLKQPCAHFHLSVQSGSTHTLRAMNRHYDAKQISDTCTLIRQFFPDAFIACDVIVGFCGESDEDFEESAKNLIAIGFSHMHIFPFSLRRGTAAEKLSQVSQQTISKRVAILTALAKKQEEEFLATQIGKYSQILIEGKKGDYHIGHTSNFIKCFVKADGVIKNAQLLEVKLKEKIFDGILVDKI